MQIYMTVYIDSITDEELSDIAYNAIKNLLYRHRDKYIPNAPVNADYAIADFIYEYATQLFDTGNKVFQFDSDLEDDIEQRSLEHFQYLVEKTIIHLFKSEAFYIKTNCDIKSELKYAKDEGDLIVFESKNWALLFDSNRFNNIID